jgi:magnesium transporter
VIRVVIHTDKGQLKQNLSLQDVSDVLDDKDHLIWIDLAKPTDDEIRRVAEELSLHPLGVEDATHAHQRPKLDEYDGHLVIIFYDISLDEGELHTRQIALFVGKNFIATIHDQDCTALDDVEKRWRDHIESVPTPRISTLLYAILDALVDGYYPVTDQIGRQVDATEEQLIAGDLNTGQRNIILLRRHLLNLRRIISPEREVLNTLTRRDVPFFDEHAVYYFQDVYDHILREMDAIDTYRDLMSSLLDIHLSMTSNRLNKVMKTLTGASIILMVASLITGIYGMNFTHMPELDWRFGYAYALALIAGISAVLFWALRRRDWL